MSIRPLRIGEKEAKLPIIQGGMGVGVGLSGLAGAVAHEGGVGMISTAQIGFREPDFEEDCEKANLRAMKKELEKARRIAAGPDGSCPGLVGYNIMNVTNDYPAYVRAAVEAGADLIATGAGLPAELPAYVEGSGTPIGPIVSSEKAARIILKLWDRHYGRTADFLVIESAHAGGHLGFSNEELKTIYEEGYEERYDEEIRRIIRCVQTYEDKYGKEIPVIVGGGIMTKEKADHMFSLGADGIQVATPFVTTEECDAAPEFKQMYIDAEPEDIEIIVSPVGMPARAIHNEFLDRLAVSKPGIPRCLHCMKQCNPDVAPYCITDALIRSVQGDTVNGLVFCGDNAGYLTRISTVREVIQSLFYGAGNLAAS